ncbi:SMC family ATPase [Actinocrispum sp. NPDC049592]|uniref:SMC family ATPase n=1 Tax=Actinocrispum sp. NPDC049592 TaxID=3154835 RepID=UPI003430D193
MRLHSLEVTAFGPYPGTESVDFDVLGADGLFLLHGETGAGKTTLLDAIAFALFGRVPGVRNEARRLRCDYADNDTLTEVKLELTIQGHRLRIVRSPEYERPKKRGDGMTKQQAKVSLVWVGDPPSGYERDGLIRIEEVARTVERLLGMVAEQFFQVVLLPQGEFARFLRADTTEREHLLEKLFGTDRFAEVERWFRDRRTERYRVLETRRADAMRLVARVAQAAGEEPPEDHAADEDWLTVIAERLGQAESSAREKAKLAGETAAAAEQALTRGRELSVRVARLRNARAELAECEQMWPQQQEWIAERAAARRAVPVVVANRAAVQLRAELADAERAAADAIGAARRAGFNRVDAEEPVLREESARLREEAGGLAQLMEEVKQQKKAQNRLTRLINAEWDADVKVNDLEAELVALPEQLRAARERLVLASEAAARLDGLTARKAELVTRIALRGKLLDAENAVTRTERGLQSAIDVHQQARERSLTVRARRLEGMAAELASRLADGDPCPVCGSPEHPAPAQTVPGAVSEAEEAAATAAEQDAQSKRAAAERAHQAAVLDVAGLRERLGPDEDEAAELSRVDEELTSASALAANRVPELDRVRELDERTASISGLLSAAKQELVSVRTEREQLGKVVNDRAKRLDPARGEYPDVRARREHLVAQADAVAELVRARAQCSQLRTRVAAQTAEVQSAAAEAGFADVDTALAAARDELRLADLDRMTSELDNRRAAARAVLAEPELADVDAEVVIDLEGMADDLATAREAADAEVAVLREVERRSADVRALAMRLRAEWTALTPVEAEYAELAALTDVVNGRGQNARRMSLRSYVLAARLEEVAVAATARLSRMSQGRYSFVHSDAAGSHGTRGGLGLDVLDDYSGKIRPAKTLSGGESFLASLALALGLADVVAAETGGALLDTLFVDEGFGTLDADTLDEVMDTLDELRAGGRVVGLVSHVEELRQRIPVRLRVRKARSGSTLEVVA